MLSLLPSSPPAATDSAYAILALVTDPVAAKKRLDELVAEKAASLEAIKTAKAHAAAAERYHANVKSSLAEDDAKLREREAAVSAAEAKAYDAMVAAKEQKDKNEAALSDIASKHAALRAREIDLTEKSKSIADREAAMLVREAGMSRREADVADKEAKAQALVKEANDRAAKLKAAVGAFVV